MHDDGRAALNGRYRLGELLGEGAVGTVHRAWDDVLQRDVAVKLLRPAYASDERAVARFQAHARAAARVAHPHAVLVYDVVAAREHHAIVMEYVSGTTLERVLAADGSVGEARAIRYSLQIARALAAAHARGLLHGDIKPANVLLSQSDAVKVADFSLASAVENCEPSQTEAGRLIGSAAYLSPERARGLPLTAASDLYALGVVLHRLVTGRLPFTGTNPIAVAVAHVTSPAPAEDALARTMQPALAAIVARLLRKDPAERYASAHEVADALAVLDTAPPRTAPAWDAPTDTAIARVRVRTASNAAAGARAAPHADAFAPHAAAALRIARTATTALAALIVVVAGIRVVGDHHVTLQGLRHLTVRHAVHTALVEAGLRPRTTNRANAPDQALATIESDGSGANPGN